VAVVVVAAVVVADWRRRKELASGLGNH